MQIPALLYGTAWKEEQTAELAYQALRAGFCGIDTANQRRHYHEAGVGEALARAYREKLVTREQIFLQTKFTYLPGQDHRLPYDANSPLPQQVEQSLASSLEHLGTDYVDSFVLHGPLSGHSWTEGDALTWDAMVREREAGRCRAIGMSNVGIRHLLQQTEAHSIRPAFVQNRCFARTGWDREVRAFCRDHDIVYQGFSLLTANLEVLRAEVVHNAAQRLDATPPQVVFAFARSVGMVPLTGTSDPAHMQQDLASLSLALTPEEVVAIENLHT